MAAAPAPEVVGAWQRREKERGKEKERGRGKETKKEGMKERRRKEEEKRKKNNISIDHMTIQPPCLRLLAARDLKRMHCLNAS